MNLAGQAPVRLGHFSDFGVYIGFTDVALLGGARLSLEFFGAFAHGGFFGRRKGI
jgi:hypothetical protein